MKLDCIYNDSDDTVEITYQENPTCPVQTIRIARGDDNHLWNALEDFQDKFNGAGPWEYHLRDDDTPYHD